MIMGLMIGTIIVWEIGKLIGRVEGRKEIWTMVSKLNGIERKQHKMWEEIKRMERERERRMDWVKIKDSSRKELEKIIKKRKHF